MVCFNYGRINIMRLITLRGLPGCGKSVIAKKLGEKLNVEVIKGDFFKLEFMKNSSSFKEACSFAYDKIFEKIKELFDKRNKIIIVEELFNDKDLFEKIKVFCLESNIEIVSFYIDRDLEKLLEVENKRERKIKNSKEDFEKLKKEIKEIKIENEVVIDNNGIIENTVDFIIDNLKVNE